MMMHDVDACKLVKTIQCQPGRVGTLAWNGDITSESEDGVILEHDGRTPSLVVQRRLLGHQGKVSRK
jgi:hypothetical protein